MNRKLTPRCKPVGSEEHGKEKSDHGIIPQHVKQSHDFGLPRWVTGKRNFRAIGADHVLGLDHHKWKRDSDAGHAKESDLKTLSIYVCDEGAGAKVNLRR